MGTRSPLEWAALGSCAALLSACGAVHNAGMWMPRTFGLVETAADVYVEPTMGVPERMELQRQIVVGRAQVERFFGSVTTSPYFVACTTNDCAVRFGSYGGRAAAFGETAIRLSPSGLSAPIIAHEWAHAEVYRRVGGWWQARRIPRWFDEGVAVVIADETRHSQANWEEIQRRGLATPALHELISRSDWTQALIKYGETQGDDPANLRRVYSVAGHAVRGFLACAGPIGVVDVLDRVRAGESFDSAYARSARTCVR